MLKNKVIEAFVAIWFAVCLSYGGPRATLVAVLGESVASAQEVTASWEDSDTTSQPVVVVEREVTEEPTEASPEEPEDEPTETMIEEPEGEAAETSEAEPAEKPATVENLEEVSSWEE